MEKEDNGRDRFAMKETDPHSPSPSPEPQDVRGRLLAWADALTSTHIAGMSVEDIAVAGGGYLPDDLREAAAALAQSDAQPVPWMWRDTFDDPDCWQFTTKKENADKLKRDNVIIEPLYTTPPRPDTSGLIEAAPDEVSETATRIVNRIRVKWAISIDVAIDLHGICQEEIEAHCFRARARAANRSAHGEAIPDCPTKGVAARQGNGG